MSTKNESSEASTVNEKHQEHTEIKFYGFLKDAQPFAFLASFSIIIAVFAFGNDEMDSISEYATIASSMFLVSFIVSILGRIALFRESVEKADRSIYTDLARFSTFFFFGMGIIHLVLIISEFAIMTPSISSIAVSWTPIFFGFALLVWRRKEITNLLKTGSRVEKGISINYILLIILLIFMGTASMIKALTGFEIISVEFSVYVTLALSASLLIALFSTPNRNKKTKGSARTTTGALVNLLIPFILMIITIVIIVQVQDDVRACDDECKIKFENLGFVCYEEEEEEVEGNFSCRFIGERSSAVIIPQGTSSMPNERNFLPEDIVVTLEIDNVIRFTNSDSVAHAISHKHQSLENKVSVNKTSIIRFNEIGTFEYRGESPWMKGTVTVNPLNNDYQKGRPITQISNDHDVLYKIFRETDKWGKIENIYISSDSVEITTTTTNQTEPKVMKLKETIVGKCLTDEKNNRVTTTYLTLVEIKNEAIPYAIFKEFVKNEPQEMCDDDVFQIT